MLYLESELCLTQLLAKLPNLPQPVVFWDGNAGQVVVAYAPRLKRICFTTQELDALCQEITTSSTQGLTEASWSGFTGGWAGYFSYEAGHNLLLTPRQHSQPLAEFGYYDFVWRGSLATGKLTLICKDGQADIIHQQLQAYLDTPNTAMQQAQNTASLSASWQPYWQFNQYQTAFNQVQNYLRAGDCYQVNLAMPYTLNADMRERSPVPVLEHFNPTFGGYFKSEYLTLTSVSPERFISLAGDKLETRPIKGTVARGRDTAEDEANKAWLASSAKNQSENLMIVDLLRNDLSRYALPHSVKVEKLFALETHANVHHLVSTISAIKPSHISASEVIKHALPGGSITGAPKKRAMEIIAELEGQSRGPYCGALGYFGQDGQCDFNILIRTVVARAQGAQCWAGGGLVLDSDCQEEWQELHTKLARILAQF